jgi:hypothetical protein
VTKGAAPHVALHVAPHVALRLGLAAWIFAGLALWLAQFRPLIEALLGLG